MVEGVDPRASSAHRYSGLGALAAATMVLSATLVFSVQPLFGRLILPHFGGVPAVWNTAMLFFQAALLAGYAYAHLLARHVPPGLQAAVHGTLLGVAMLFLPAALPENWSPPDGRSLPTAILLVLSASIGIPFVVASATAPLLQSWYARAHSAQRSDPYFLYAASNVGSLLGLVSYPLLVEPRLGLADQGRLWMAGFALLAAGTLACGLVARARLSPREPKWRTETTETISWRRRLHWMALAAAPSSLLIAVTQHVSTNVTAMPLLWVAPLILYLATFVIAFARSSVLPEPILKGMVPFFAVMMVIVTPKIGFGTVLPALAVHYSMLFLLALFCHVDLYARRPAAPRLTEFYLCMSFGGLLGTAFNSIAAPLIFSDITEYPLAVAGVLVLWALRYDPGGPLRVRSLTVPAALFVAFKTLSPALAGWGLLAPLLARTAGAAIAFAPGQRPLLVALSGAALLLGTLGQHGKNQEIYSHRSFFGVHRVKLDAATDTILLVHGDTVHGAQSRRESLSREPLGYYGLEGPLGQVFAAEGQRLKRIGTVGLGTASVACHGPADARRTFFEIDPAIIDTAQTRFSYLRTCAPHARIVVGDGRLNLSVEPDAAFDLLIIDAFSSDAVPLHLLTREAIALYMRKLAPDGLLMMHISNRYMHLAPVVAALADDAGIEARVQFHSPDSADSARHLFGSAWVALAREKQHLASIIGDARWSALPRSGDRVWTDDYANVAGAVGWTTSVQN